MSTWDKYYQSYSITDALQALAASQGSARVIAGGTDLLLDIQQGRTPPVHTLVDVNTIPEMTCIELRAEWLFIGAAVPLNLIVSNPLVQFHAPALIEACNLIGGPQVRNAATLGGNVSHALPAADGSIALLAQGSEVEIASLEGLRRVLLQSLYLGPGRSVLRTGQELLVGFYLPQRKKGEGSAFRRVMRPQGVALPVLNMAAWVRREDEQIADVRIAIGPAGPIPFRAMETEAFLRGKEYNEHVLADTAESVNCEACFRTSPHRATTDYRCRLASVLLAEVMTTAWRRASDPADSQEFNDYV